MNDDMIDNTQVEIDDSFSYDGYQVVRGEFFAHQLEPSITFNNKRFYVNTACLKKLPDVEYILVLVNADDKKIVLRPCTEDTKDALPWKTKSGRPKQTSCKVFSAMIMNMMEWKSNYRYKIMGKLIQANGEFLFVFDLMSREEYPRTVSGDSKVINARDPLYPAEWKNQFGLTVEEHKKQLHIDTFNGYSVFNIREKESSDEEENKNESAKTDTGHEME